MLMRNIRPMAFGVNVGKENQGYYIFGPLQPGEFVDSVSMLFNMMGLTGSLVDFVDVEISVFDQRPRTNGTDFINGHPLVGSSPCRFPMTLNQPTQQARFPLKLASSLTERYVVVKVDNASVNFGTMGFVAFDIGFDPVLAAKGFQV